MMFSSQHRRKRNKGFTLIEVLVSLFMFLTIMTAVSQIFVSAFSGYRYTKTVQLDVEAAQFALNTLAKELRTSSVVSAAGNQSFVKFYDHSQGVCFLYRVSGGNLQVARQTATGVSDCRSKSLPAFTAIATDITAGRFLVVPSDAAATPLLVGKVTISLEIAQDAAHRARIQSSVSLVDYGESGFIQI